MTLDAVCNVFTLSNICQSFIFKLPKKDIYTCI